MIFQHFLFNINASVHEETYCEDQVETSNDTDSAVSEALSQSQVLAHASPDGTRKNLSLIHI